MSETQADKMAWRRHKETVKALGQATDAALVQATDAALEKFPLDLFNRIGAENPCPPDELAVSENALTGIAAAILQEEDRKVSVIVGVAASKIVAASLMAGTFSAIGAFGVASTGTAIATLSGAAATTATLYWIGSLFGGGVVLGGTVLTGGTIIAAVPAAWYVKRQVVGKARKTAELEDHEKALLFSTLRLASAFRVVRESDVLPSRSEFKITFSYGIDPLLSALADIYLSADDEKPTVTLSWRSKRKIRKAIGELKAVLEQYK